MRFLAIIDIDARVDKYSVATAFENWLNKQEIVISEYGTPRLAHPKCTGIIYDDLPMVAHSLQDASDRLLSALALKKGEINPKPKTPRKRNAGKR